MLDSCDALQEVDVDNDPQDDGVQDVEAATPDRLSTIPEGTEPSEDMSYYFDLSGNDNAELQEAWNAIQLDVRFQDSWKDALVEAPEV